MLSIRVGNGAPEAAPADEFDAAVKNLAEAVQAWIREAAPRLTSHPAWKDWFEPAVF